jgi:uncharacterized membrane protein YeaQ/YmgE (transglycosylase-associated protein family)
MSLVEIIMLLVIAAICGSLAQLIVGYSHGGCLVSAALGLIGAVIGEWIARALNLPEILPLKIGDHPFPIVWSIIGAALFVAVLGLATRRRLRPPGR